MTTPPTVIHIGPAKAASSSIQRAMRELESRGLIDFVGPDNPAVAHTVSCSWGYDSSVWDSVSSGLRPTVVSAESLWGATWVGFLGGPEAARRLAEKFPDATIVLVIRRNGWTSSAVRQYWREGGTRSAAKLLAKHPSASSHRLVTPDPHAVITFYRSLGCSVVAFEMDQAVKGICSIVGVEDPPDIRIQNRTPGPARLWLVRNVLNRLITTPLSDGGIPVRPRTADRARHAIESPMHHLRKLIRLDP